MAIGSYEGSPADGRHPRSSRGVSVTRNAHGWSRRYGASSDPCTKAKSRGHGEDAALAKAREAVDETSERDRGVRGSVASAPWEENAHAHDEGREATIMRLRVASRSAEAVSGVVKRSIPPVMPFGA
jgi:hypothetical protein